MIISDIAKQKILDEFNSFEQFQYNGKSVKERKELNQFFTSPELSIKLIENLDSIEGDLVDPCCGAGNLLMAAAIVKVYDLNESPLTVFGFDIDEPMVNLIKDRFFKYFNLDFSNNFSVKDSTLGWNKSFNVCLTNPPFNKNGADLLELSIINNVVNYCDVASVLCTVTNITDINGPLKQGKKWEKYRNVLEGKLESIDIIKDSSSYFGICTAKDLGILKIVKDTEKDFNDFRFIQNGINYKFIYEKVYKLVVNNKIGLNLHWTDSTEPYCVPLKVLVSKNNYNLVTYKQEKRNHKSAFKPSKSVKIYDNENTVSKNVVFDTEKEAENFRSACMTKFYRFLVKHSLTSQNIKNVNKFIPFLDFTKTWTDQMLYKLFDLTDTEINIIETEIDDL